MIHITMMNSTRLNMAVMVSHAVGPEVMANGIDQWAVEVAGPEWLDLQGEVEEEVVVKDTEMEEEVEKDEVMEVEVEAVAEVGVVAIEVEDLARVRIQN